MASEQEDKTTPFLPHRQNSAEKRKEHADMDSPVSPTTHSACCGLPLPSWYSQETEQPQSSTFYAKNTAEMSAAHTSSVTLPSKSVTSLSSSMYKLFTCDVPLNFCSCGTCMFCDSAYSNKKVLSGPRVPNSVYTEVVVQEPKRSSGFCLGWWGEKPKEGMEVKTSPIYKGPQQSVSMECIRRTDSAEVVSKPPARGMLGENTESHSAPGSATLPRRSKKAPIIPWNTEFKSRSVIIEDRPGAAGDLQESEVLFNQESADSMKLSNSDSHDSGYSGSLSTSDIKEKQEKENKSSSGEKSDTREELKSKPSDLYLVESNLSDACEDSESDNESFDDKDVEIPLTPFTKETNDWNGRLEIKDGLLKN